MKKLLILTVLVFSASVLYAQTPSIAANARVLADLTVTGTKALEFGDVVPGTAETVLPTNATAAGTFTISGDTGAAVTLNFTLPENLLDDAIELPISFSATSAGRNVANTIGSQTAFDPNSAESTTLDGSTGNLYVWIGGTVTPGGSQAAGNYTGTITLAVTYN